MSADSQFKSIDLYAARDAVCAAGDALLSIARPELIADVTTAAAPRGYFTPDEDERLRDWWAKYLTARAALFETIEELAPMAQVDVGADSRDTTEGGRAQCVAFAIAYAAACVLVRAGRRLVREIAGEKIVQRKLNEADSSRRIPRKQFTSVYKSLTSPRNAWRLLDAREAFDRQCASLDPLRRERDMNEIFSFIDAHDEALRLPVRQYLRSRLRFRRHSALRRGASAVQQALFELAEAVGCVVADIGDPTHTPRLDPDVFEELTALLRPGDVIVTRRDRQLSNLFLPGYWPHAALYVGRPGESELACINDKTRARWTDRTPVLEARKDGVRLRELSDTFSVDATAILRPNLEQADIRRALERALRHDGKPYNFDFDFFTEDRIVCTEIVYRAYEGVGPITFQLTNRSGRPTLSAEDLVDLAREGRGFAAAALVCPRTTRGKCAIDAEAADGLLKIRDSA